jgi:WD40 repeat protein
MLHLLILILYSYSCCTHTPADPRGVLCDVSDRNLVCLSYCPATSEVSSMRLESTYCTPTLLILYSYSEVVLGSCDHGLYGYDVNTGRKTRSLYSKRCGHSEWVTSCTHTPSGGVVSAAMDGKICVWGRSGNSCVDLLGHRGSVSKVIVNEQGGFAVLILYSHCAHTAVLILL